MEIIEISPSCVCARVWGVVPKGKEGLYSVAQEIFKKCGISLWGNAEIEAYSNGVFSLIFISRNPQRNSADRILHTFAV